MKNKLTIVIPTHNRHEYLSRVLDYYSDIEYTILIADSSKKKYEGKLGENIKYVHFENYSLMDKLNVIIKTINTPYMFFCADDDFWIKENILECISFLDENETYSSVQGRYISFYIDNNFNIDQCPSYLFAKDLEINDTSSLKRLELLKENYMPLFYAMHRKSHIQRVFNDCSRFNITHGVLVELIVAYYTIISGSYKTLEILTYCRDAGSGNSENINRENLKQIVENNLYVEEYNTFKNMILKYLNRQGISGLKIEDIENILDIYICQISYTKVNKNKEFIKKLIPKKLISKRNSLLEKKFILSQNNIVSLNNEKGYPSSDKQSMIIWEELKNIIERHLVINE